MIPIENLKNLPFVVWVLALLIILALPATIVYLRKNFQVSEIISGPPWLKLTRKNQTKNTIRQNLPQPDYERFIGREIEINQIRNILRPYPYSQHAIVTIDGVGGVGKSALALEVAHGYLHNADRSQANERFAAIIWVSAKRSFLTSDGEIPRKQALRTIDDIYSAIAVTLDQDSITQSSIQDKPALVRKILTQQRTLLIVDNLETVDDQSVIDFLRELPAPSKAIITTRHRIDVAFPIRLTGMEWKDARELIADECKKKGFYLGEEDQKRLFDRTGGIPLAIVWSIAQLGLGHSPETVLRRLGQPTGDVARYCFDEVVRSIRNKPCYQLLAALSISTEAVTRQKLGYVANLSELDRDDGLVELEKLSLINREGNVFTMLPLTQLFISSDLEKDRNNKEALEKRYSVIPFEDLIPPVDTWWTNVSTYNLRVSIGLRSDGQPVEFALGENIGNTHVLVSGMTGTGKTSFLIALIMNLAFNYPPEELSFMILDPKSMEYYSLEELPHAQSIGHGFSDENYHLFFKNLEQEVNRRTDLLRLQQVDSYESYRKKVEQPLPRLIVLIEEFPHILSNDASRRSLLKLISISRSLGIHFLFTTQTPRALNNIILSQISCRFVLRSFPDDLQQLLGEDWNIADDLSIGEVVFKDYSGVRRFKAARFVEVNGKKYIDQLKQLAVERHL